MNPLTLPITVLLATSIVSLLGLVFCLCHVVREIAQRREVAKAASQRLDVQERIATEWAMLTIRREFGYLIEGHELHKTPTAVVRERWQRAFDLLFVKTVRTGDEHLNALRANLADAGFEAWEIDSLLQRYQKRPLALLSVLSLRLLAFREIAPELMVKRAKKEQHSR